MRSTAGLASGTAQILSLCEQAAGAITPSHPEQERQFTELDDILSVADDRLVEAVLGDARFRRIREQLLVVRAEYEYAREQILARAIVAAGDESPLCSFRSASWYEEAHEFEIRALAPYAPRRLLVVGAGPFPTTAISFMRAHPDALVACIERVPQACSLASDVARICGCEELQMIHAEALEVTEFADYDCVIVGTVVGVTDTEKERVVDHFMSRVPTSTLLVFRTAIGPGRIIYPTVESGALNGMKHRVLTDPPQKTFTMIITDRGNLAA